MAVLPLRDGKEIQEQWSGHLLQYGSMMLRHTVGTSSSAVQDGLTLTDASRLQQVKLETVNHYDEYTFASLLDTQLFKSEASAKGYRTGSIVYGSSGKKSVSAVTYDDLGRIASVT